MKRKRSLGDVQRVSWAPEAVGRAWPDAAGRARPTGDAVATPERRWPQSSVREDAEDSGASPRGSPEPRTPNVEP